MFNAQNVNAKLTLTNTVCEDSNTSYYFACNEQVTLAGDSFWGYTQAGDVITVTSINVHERDYEDGEVYYDVNVTLAEGRLVYEDDALTEAVSNLLNTEVDYTEQGLQDYGTVSMEL